MLNNWRKLLCTIMIIILVIGKNTIPIEAATNTIPSEALQYNGHYYYLYTTDSDISWTEAKNACEKLGGHLVTITNASEQAALEEYLSEDGINMFYIGATAKDGTWKWITNEQMEYTNILEKDWLGGVTNISTASDNGCRMVYAPRYGWNWTWGGYGYPSDSNGYICEWDYQITLGDSVEEISNFDLNVYRANFYLQDGTPANNAIESMLSLSYPSQTIVDALNQNNNSFQKRVEQWEAVHYATSPSDIINGKLDEKGYYEAIILSIFVSQSENSNYLADQAKKINAETNTLLESVSDWIEQSDSIAMSQISKNQILSEMSKEDIETIREYCGAKFEENHPSLNKGTNITGTIETIFESSTTIIEAFERMCAYTQLCELSQQQKAVLKEMHDICPSSNIALKSALSEVVDSMDSYNSALAASLGNAATSQGNQFIGTLMDEGWDSVIKSNPYSAAFMAGASFGTFIGDSVCNSLFSTDKTIEQYIKMKCLGEFNQLMQSVLSNFEDVYQNNKTSQNAKNYFEAIDAIFAISSLSCDFATSYGDIIYDDALIGKLVNRSEDIDEFYAIIEQTKKDYETIHQTLTDSYLVELEVDYPESYKIVMGVENDEEIPVVSEKTASEMTPTPIALTDYFKYYGDAKLCDNGEIQLTPLLTWASGSVWYEQSIEITNGMKISFDYWAGGGRNKSLGGADGFVLMLSDKPGLGDNGADLGFVIGDGSYGVEFDSYYNLEHDPKGKHMAIVKDDISNHLKYISTTIVDDGEWHHAEVCYSNSVMQVYVDQNLMLEYEGIDFEKKVYIGYSASTGAGINLHKIKNPTLELTPVKNTTNISKTAQMELEKEIFVYNGEAKKPEVIVMNNSDILTQNKDFNVKYSNNKNVGTAIVTVTGIGEYSGTIVKKFTILPKGTSLSGEVAAKSKGFVVKWKKQNEQISGYQIEYSTSNKFAKKNTVSKNAKVSSTKMTVSTLKAKKKYYVRIRTYKKINGKTYYSAWSNVKSVKTTNVVGLAATKPKAPKKVTAKVGVYYDYIEKQGIEGGEGYSLKVSWSSVSKVTGYQIKLYWDSEGSKCKQTINVTKKNEKYYYTTTDGKIYKIYRAVKDMIAGGGEKERFSSKKLSFCVSGGSCESVYKITVKNYKKVNGKKVYSNAKTKKLRL